MEILEHDYYASTTKIAGITIDPGAKCKPWPRAVVEACLSEIRLDLDRVFPKATIHIMQQAFGGGHDGYCRVWNRHVHVFLTSQPLVSDSNLTVPYMHSILAHELGHGYHHLYLMGKEQEAEYLDKRYMSSSLKPDSEWFAEDFRFVYGGELAQVRPHKGEQFFKRDKPRPDVLEWLKGLFDSALPEDEGQEDVKPMGKVIELRVGKTVAMVDGKEALLDVGPIIHRDRTMIPLRFVSEAMGHVVDWGPKPGPVEWVKIIAPSVPVPNMQIAPHFGLHEFACGCCGRVLLNSLFEELVRALETLRERIGGPISVTSGYRCPEHNRVVGGVPDSQHTKGAAADIASGFGVANLAREARAVGFRYVQEYPTKGFVHVDMRR